MITANLFMFVILAVVILGSAIMCVFTKCILRALTFLLFVLFVLVGMFFLIEYTYLGAAQISVYEKQLQKQRQRAVPAYKPIAKASWPDFTYLTYSPPRHDAPSVVGLPRTGDGKPRSVKPDIVKKPSCSLRHK